MHLTRRTMGFRRVCFVFWGKGVKQFLDLLSNKTRLLTEDKTYFSSRKIFKKGHVKDEKHNE